MQATLTEPSEAAGTAADLALKTGREAVAVDVPALQARLESDSADLARRWWPNRGVFL